MKTKMKLLKRCVALVLVIGNIFTGTYLVSADVSLKEEASKISNSSLTDDSLNRYFSYYKHHADKELVYNMINIDVLEYSASDTDAVVSKVGGTDAVVLNDSNKWCEWEFTAKESGMYALYFDYYQHTPSNGKNIAFSCYIDGKLPYDDAYNFELTRYYKDNINEGESFNKDKNGNDLRPTQVEYPAWRSTSVYDSQGLYEEPYLIYIQKGKHTLKFAIIDESVAITNLSLGVAQDAISYAEYISKYEESDFCDGSAIIQEAEITYDKTSTSLYPTTDRSSSNVTPCDPYSIKLNTIGQTNWQERGETISWKVGVKKSGLYRIVFHVNQSYNQGMNSYRTLKVNGEVPFAEAQNISFAYNPRWYTQTFGGENEYYIYLKSGDIISLECVCGDTGEILREVQQSVLDLNNLYSEILRITGASPDIYQDYSLDNKIDNLSGRLEDAATNLDNCMLLVKASIGTTGASATTIAETAQMLHEMADDTYQIIERFSYMKSQLEDLGSLILTLQQQPLELDWISFVPKNADKPTGEASFIDGFLYSLRKFIKSFATDYDTMSSEGDDTTKEITVWVSAGRDQAQIITNMINDTYSVTHDVAVNLGLVNTGATMLQAALANKGPDVALQVGMDYPVNLAMRGALVDLSKYDFSELKNDTTAAAWEPLYYNDSLYGIPETENFSLLFYRTDIFEELGLSVPNTWDEFYDVMELLQADNYEVGIMEIDSANAGVSAGIPIFNTFLFQLGSTYYNDSLTETLFNSDEAYNAFTRWVELYTKYGLDREFNFFNRFRSGEMAMSIQGYGVYSQLSAAAPEIKGLWDFAPIPGTVREDGTIDRSESSTITASIVLKAAQKNGVVDEAVEFVKWWTSAETQARYGSDLENMLGVAARYTPASYTALRSLAWSDDEISIITKQREHIQNVPEIPGNYLIARSLTGALRSAISGTNLPRRALSLYNIDINNEITRKRKEFGLE